MNNEQKKKLSQMISANRSAKSDREIDRIKLRISAEIENFSRRYEFADTETAARISDFIDGLLFCRPALVDLEGFSNRRCFSPNEADGRNIWICFLLGDEELFKIFVKCGLQDFFVDFDEWTFYSPYLLLLYDNFRGFIFIDDNEVMTEITL